MPGGSKWGQKFTPPRPAGFAENLERLNLQGEPRPQAAWVAPGGGFSRPEGICKGLNRVALGAFLGGRRIGAGFGCFLGVFQSVPTLCPPVGVGAANCRRKKRAYIAVNP